MRFKGDIIITDPCYIMRAEYHGTKPLTKDDWRACDYGNNMEALGIKNYLTSSTEYGDWSCTTVKDDIKSQAAISEMNKLYFEFYRKYNFTGLNPEEKEQLYKEYEEARAKIDTKDCVIGNFCADAGLVSVFLLEEVLTYNPDFDYHINRPWTTTLIKDFDGDIEITHRETTQSEILDEEEAEEHAEEYKREVSVVGKGNINFYTTQTGF